jgi:hypothetical protein
MPYNQCQYIGRHGDVCGRNCMAAHTQSTRCAIHRGKISSVKCFGCDTFTRSLSQLCTTCNKSSGCSISMTPFLLTKAEIQFIMEKREQEKNDQVAEDSD